MSKQINVNLSECEDVECECGNKLFAQAFILKRVPGIMIAQPKDKIVNVAQMVCTHCSAIHDPSKGADPIKEKSIKIVH